MTCETLTQFLETVKDREYYDAMYLLERRTTEAERALVRQTGGYAAGTVHGTEAANLKSCLTFLRFGLKPRGVDPAAVDVLARLRHAYLSSPRPRPCPRGRKPE